MATVSINYFYASGSNFECGYGWTDANPTVTRYSQFGLDNPPTTQYNHSTSGAVNGNLATTLGRFAIDTTHYYYGQINDGDGTWVSGVTSGRSTASVAAAETPTYSAVTSTTATIACNYTPNVVQSTCSAQLQYKKNSDSTWSDAGAAQTTGGSAQIPISRDITGLTSSTLYNVRLVITRTTVNDTSLTSATASFTTAAGVPTVTTNAATSVAHATATLNDTIAVNEGTTVTTYWKWGTDNPPTQNTTASQAVSGDGSFSVGISGLTASTLYYAQAYVAFATPSGSPSSGAVVNFTTSSDPAAEAADEDHMTIQEYDAVYGVEKAFVFLAASPAASSSNTFLSAAAPWATTECRITIDGGAVADCTNAPTRIGTSAFYTITLTASELTGENIWVHISDSAVAARDVALHIRTSQELGKMVLNASQMTNTTALAATGVGTGHGASFVAGATGKDIDGTLGEHLIRKNVATGGGASTVTLDASASATNDFYNGAVILIISGTGAGQSRFITDYDGGTKVATVHKAWGTNPANNDTFMIIPAEDTWSQAATAELSGIPTAASSWADKLAFLFQRFAYKRTQTATVHTMFKADSSTSLGTAAVADDGTTQSFAKVS